MPVRCSGSFIFCTNLNKKMIFIRSSLLLFLIKLFLFSTNKSRYVASVSDCELSNPLCAQIGLAYSRRNNLSNNSSYELTIFLPVRIVSTLFKDVSFEFICLSAFGRVSCTAASSAFATTSPEASFAYFSFRYDEVDTKVESYFFSESRRLMQSIGATTAHVMIGNASSSSIFSFQQRDISYFVRDISDDNKSLSRIVDISYPLYGQLVAGPLKILFSCDASVSAPELKEYEDKHQLLSASATSEVDFEVQSIFKQSFPADAQAIDSLNGDIEPASWFFHLRPKIVFPMRNSMQTQMQEQEQWQFMTAFGLPSHGYIEFVLTREDIKRNQLFNNQTTREHSLSSKVVELPIGGVPNLPSRDRATEDSCSVRSDCTSSERSRQRDAKSSPPLHICIWGSNDMDGQKRIWLQQIESLGKARSIVPGASFRFSWILSLPEGKQLILNEQGPDLFRQQNREFIEFGNSVLKQLLTYPHCRVVNSPFNGFSVQVDDLEQRPRMPSSSSDFKDGFNDYGVPSGGPVVDVWQGDMERLYAYAHNRFTLSRGNLSDLSPSWVETFYMRMRDFLLSENCDLMVYGNSRGFSSDVLITDVCGLLGYPTATELLNLFADTRVLADAVIAPSLFALQHESIGRLKDAYQRAKGTEMITAIVQPGVDVWHTFNPATYFSERDRGEILGDALQGRRIAFSIGFIGRLAPEKSVGLFLQAAYSILRAQPFCRFVIIGDGDLRPSLEELAQRLGIFHAVEFVGWISTHEKLARQLLSLDIVINTSLRAWSETFCISNIEAMSLAVPLVTFAVGGVGEYVRMPPVGNPEQFQNFSVSSNAVLVHDAHPDAIAAATLYLLANSTLRKSIGLAGRQTVVDYFNIDRQMQQYALLYRDIIHRKGST